MHRAARTKQSVSVDRIGSEKDVFMPSVLMHDGLERAAHQFGDRDAVRAGGDAWSFGQLEALAGACAHQLAGEGIGAGHRVAVVLSNRPEFLVAVHGISKLGASAVLLSPAWKALEVEH